MFFRSGWLFLGTRFQQRNYSHFEWGFQTLICYHKYRTHYCSTWFWHGSWKLKCRWFESSNHVLFQAWFPQTKGSESAWCSWFSSLQPLELCSLSWVFRLGAIQFVCSQPRWSLEAPFCRPRTQTSKSWSELCLQCFPFWLWFWSNVEGSLCGQSHMNQNTGRDLIESLLLYQFPPNRSCMGSFLGCCFFRRGVSRFPCWMSLFDFWRSLLIFALCRKFHSRSIRLYQAWQHYQHWVCIRFVLLDCL